MSESDTDSELAFMLGQKLIKVLNTNGSSKKLCKNDSTQTEVSLSNGTNEIFCISKAKKIELQNLSSRLEHTGVIQSTVYSKENAKDPSDVKPIATTNFTENQSTVIISFKSSQMPMQTQTFNEFPLNKINAMNLHSSDENINAISANNTSNFLSPNPTYAFTTPSSNVLKKVASFTVENSTTNNSVGSGICTSGLSTHMENSTFKRSTYVPEKLSFAAYQKFEGQMLIKWLKSAVPINEHNEPEVNEITILLCNNLLNIGVLKQISEKNNSETFSPFHMYQWTYTEVPPTSLSMAPKKIDKTIIWPYCNPVSSSQVAKSTQVNFQNKDDFYPKLQKDLLECATLNEVHKIAQQIVNVEESQQQSPKFFFRSSELLNLIEDTAKFEEKCLDSKVNENYKNEIYTRDKKVVSKPICSICKKEILPQTFVQQNEKSVQTYEENVIENETKTATKSIPVPPPPPKLIINKFVSLMQPTLLPLNENIQKQSINEVATVAPPVPPAPLPPAPLPNAADSEWFNQTTLRKVAVNPPKPMKPLYWTRIVTSKPITKKTSSLDQNIKESKNEIIDSFKPNEIWQEIDETNLDNIEEFTELFSRQAVVPVSKPKEKKNIKMKTMKVLDSKRSQNVGIVSRSLHFDFCEIEHAIYHVDTSIVSLETLQQIINIKATSEELELIKEASQGEKPLDHPEQFLLKISQISMSTERISCIVFQAEFEESTTLIIRKLEVVTQLSHCLIESKELKLVFSIILTLGNYMNGGNRQRGQADGFTLEILGKLKDVKSKDSHTTLLHFIVRTYINQRRKDGIQLLKFQFPIPEPADIERATQVDFDEIKIQITELKKKLNVCKKTTEKVIVASTKETLEPFKTKIEYFIEDASKLINILYIDLEKCRELFIKTMRFYHFTPKSRTIDNCTPGQFFEYWTNFTNDFKDIWKKEIIMLHEEVLKKTKEIQSQSRKNIKTTKVKPGGLKERIMRLSKK